MACMDDNGLTSKVKLCVKYIELVCFFICFFIGLSLFPIYAAPQGGEVVSGDITINSPVDSIIQSRS
jgi:hypothetical protein